MSLKSLPFGRLFLLVFVPNRIDTRYNSVTDSAQPAHSAISLTSLAQNLLHI